MGYCNVYLPTKPFRTHPKYPLDMSTNYKNSSWRTPRKFLEPYMTWVLMWEWWQYMVGSRNPGSQCGELWRLFTHYTFENSSQIFSRHVNELKEFILKNSSKVSHTIYGFSVNIKEVNVEGWVSKCQVLGCGIVRSVYILHIWQIIPNHSEKCHEISRTHPEELFVTFQIHTWSECQCQRC